MFILSWKRQSGKWPPRPGPQLVAGGGPRGARGCAPPAGSEWSINAGISSAAAGRNKFQTVFH
jgi:hypothetical protein